MENTFHVKADESSDMSDEISRASGDKQHAE
jgi:hypothetical protein